MPKTKSTSSTTAAVSTETQIREEVMAQVQDKPLWRKLSAVQFLLKAPKDTYNSFGKYSFRNAEDILEAAKPLCYRAGILLTMSDCPVTIDGKRYIECTANVTDGKDTISVCGYAKEAEKVGGMSDGQITGATSSYARKYALGGLFCVDNTKDLDSESFQIEYKSAVNASVNPATGEVTQAKPVSKTTPKKSAEPKQAVEEQAAKQSEPDKPTAQNPVTIRSEAEPDEERPMLISEMLTYVLTTGPCAGHELGKLLEAAPEKIGVAKELLYRYKNNFTGSDQKAAAMMLDALEKGDLRFVNSK